MRPVLIATANLLVLSASCGKKAETPAGQPVGSGSSSGSGSAAAPADAANAPADAIAAVDDAAAPADAAAALGCIPRDLGVRAFRADDTAAHLCVADDAAEHCFTIDLATGAAKPGKPAPAAKVAVDWEVKHDAGEVQLCKGAACTKLALPKLEGDDAGTYQVDVSADGKRAVAIGGGLEKVALLDAATGKLEKQLAVAERDYTCLEDAHFLGNVIYVVTSVCAGPGGQAALYSATGKKLRTLDLAVNPYGATPVPIKDTLYAIGDWGTNDYVVVDVKTGKQVREVEVPCDDCDGRGLDNAAEMAKTPAGKIVTISSVLAVTDPLAGKVEHVHVLPMCKADD